MKLKKSELKDFLDTLYLKYNRPGFIANDPIQVPHDYSKREDIEISAFFAATFAWGQRKTIISKSMELMSRMGREPYRFIIEHRPKDLRALEGFVHRTFNDTDLLAFVEGLRRVYSEYGSLENAFCLKAETGLEAISLFRQRFAFDGFPQRSLRHLSDPVSGSSAKRLNMLLRWMVRKDNRGVDFGIWRSLNSGELSIPLDVHSGNTARMLGLLKQKQNDRRAVEELDKALRRFDPSDPVKYDFALFGLSADGFGKGNLQNV
jgi:uncharacterized protein (TIGR02757 family)